MSTCHCVPLLHFLPCGQLPLVSSLLFWPPSQLWCISSGEWHCFPTDSCTLLLSHLFPPPPLLFCFFPSLSFPTLFSVTYPQTYMHTCKHHIPACTPAHTHTHTHALTHTHTLSTIYVCILGLASALVQCSNGALFHPRPLLHCPSALNPRDAHKTGI